MAVLPAAQEHEAKLASTFCSQLLKLKTGTLVCLQPEANCENSFPSAIWVFFVARYDRTAYADAS